MKKILFPIIKDKGTRTFVILTVLFSMFMMGCERTLDLDSDVDTASDDLTINAVAVAGNSLKVYLSHAFKVDKAPSMNYIDYEHATYQKDDGTLDYVSNEYYLKTAIPDANVEAEVNGRVYGMAWSDKDACYISNYVVNEGDYITVSASIDNKEVSVETTIPPMPRIEVVKHEVLAENPYIQMNGLIFESDTIMRLTCRITDVGSNQYYRLRVRGERSLASSFGVSMGENKNEYKLYYYMMQDVFFSSDELFADHRLTSNYGGWPPFFSNVFDNSKFNGGEKIFVVNSPKIPASGRSVLSGNELWEKEIPSIPARVMVELQALSPELYRYLKSVELYRVSESDAFSEPVQIYSNVKNGWGIFGSLSSQRVFIPYD